MLYQYKQHRQAASPNNFKTSIAISYIRDILSSLIISDLNEKFSQREVSFLIDSIDVNGSGVVSVGE